MVLGIIFGNLHIDPYRSKPFWNPSLHIKTAHSHRCSLPHWYGIPDLSLGNKWPRGDRLLPINSSHINVARRSYPLGSCCQVSGFCFNLCLKFESPKVGRKRLPSVTNFGHTCVHLYISIYVICYVYVHVCIYIYICVCACVYAYTACVFMHIVMHRFIYLFIYDHLWIYIYITMHNYRHTHRHLHLYNHICIICIWCSNYPSLNLLPA